MNGTEAVRQIGQSIKLALADFLHEWRISLCLVFALAAVLSPLLVLFGLKSGIVTTMTDRLKADPTTRELIIVGNYRLLPAWFDRLRARTDVGFVLPRTRTLAATVTLESARGQSLTDVDMLPTAAGDPVFPAGAAVPTGLNEIDLSDAAARKLGADAGDRLDAIVSRRLGGEMQGLRIPITVIGVLPDASFGHEAAFVSLPLLVATETYRDGYRVDALGVQTGAAPHADGARTFASARLYARSIDDVAGLAEAVRREGIDVQSHARDIAAVHAIDRVLTFVFIVLAGIGIGGYLLSLASSLWADVERKRRDIALLRLVGLRTASIIAFPAARAGLVAASGVLLSAAIYLCVAAAFNAAFAAELQRNEFVCRLRPLDGLIAAALTFAAALSASAVGGYRAAGIDPADNLREV
jgi:putative ABC transport system permease protein